MNRLTGLTALLVALAIPASAPAAPLGELPFEQRKGIAGCLEATGAPGGLSVLGPYSPRASATDLVTAGGARATRVSVGRLLTCAAVADLAHYERVMFETLLKLPNVADVRSNFALRTVKAPGPLPV